MMRRWIIKITSLVMLTIIALLLANTPVYANSVAWSVGYDEDSGKLESWFGYETTETTYTLKYYLAKGCTSEKRYKYGDPPTTQTWYRYGDNQYQTRTIFTGLNPNRTYTGLFSLYNSNKELWEDKPFTTDCVAPTAPVFSNIKDNQVTVTWTKSTNYSTPDFLCTEDPA